MFSIVLLSLFFLCTGYVIIGKVSPFSLEYSYITPFTLSLLLFGASISISMFFPFATCLTFSPCACFAYSSTSFSLYVCGLIVPIVVVFLNNIIKPVITSIINKKIVNITFL